MAKKLLILILSVGLNTFAMQQDLIEQHVQLLQLRDAIVIGDLNIVKKWIDDGADVNAKILLKHLLFSIHDVEGLQIPDTSALGLAVPWGRVEIVELLLSKGAKLPADIKLPESWKNKNWKKLLIEVTKKRHMKNQIVDAAKQGDLKEVCQLVANGAELNSHGIWDNLALTAAAHEGHLEVVKFLLQNGAMINKQTRNGDTAIRKAADTQNYTMVAYLLAHDADPNIQPKKGWAGGNALHSARDPRLVKLLLGHGADVFNLDNFGHTKLAQAAARGDREMVIAVLATIPNQDAKLIRDHYYTALLSLKHTPDEPRLPRDVRKLIGEKIIRRLIDEQMPRQMRRIQTLLVIKTEFSGHHTPREIALSLPGISHLRTEAERAERTQVFREIADLLDLNNPKTHAIIRNGVRSDILHILFDEPQIN